MELTILGCHAATPRTSANPTAQALQIKNHLFLIDCAEGTQVQLRRMKIKFGQIQHIFISHLHGDHCFGLIGLISTFSMLKREKELTIYGPVGIKELILFQLKLTKSWIAFPLHFKELDSLEPTSIFEDDQVSVTTIPLQHRIYCNGYLFREKPGDRKLVIAEVEKYNIPVAYYKSIKKGKDITLDNGRVIANELLTQDPIEPKSYAFCSDTKYDEKKVQQLLEVTTLYHESTFIEKHKALAAPTGHSTAMEAAEIAKKARVKQLILGHFSTRYDDLRLFESEAKIMFSKTHLARDGGIFKF